MWTADRVRRGVMLSVAAAFVLAAGPGWAITPNPDGNPRGTDILLWHLDDTTGNTWTDSATGGMNGTGSAVSVAGLLRAPGAPGLGAAGNLPDSGISSPPFASVKGHEFTFECWLYWPTGTDPRAANQLIADRRGTDAIWYLKANVMGTGGAPDTLQWAAWTSPSATSLITGPCSFQNNVWYHVAVTCKHLGTDNNTVKIYCTPAPAPGVQMGPPVLMATATGVHDMPATAGTSIKVGGGVTGGMVGRNFDGYIDEVRLSSVALDSFDSFAPPPAPTVRPSSVTLARGNTQQFACEGATPPITWAIIDESVLGVGTIDSTGLFTALKVGTCRVRAIDANNIACESQTITVESGGLYSIAPLSESQLVSLYETIMIDGVHYANSSWHTWSVDPSGGYWGNGVSDGNEGIRAIACMVITCGALLKYCDRLTPSDRADFLAKSIAATRYVTATHVTGTQNCTDGKKWGNAWQSAYWAGILALGTRLIWNDLPTDLQAGVKRVVAYEADRFLSVTPPSGSYSDTKAEENAWNEMCIAAAPSMFPEEAHAAAWTEKAIQYAMNTLSAAQDEQDNTIVDGKPVSQWVCTENVHPDFTLENHGIFHPSYMQCSMYILMPAVMHRVYAGQPVEQGLTHHIMDVWNVFQSLMLPSGETIFPQGMDWEMHNLPAVNLYANLSTYKADPVAAAAEKAIAQYMRAWQQWCGGSLTLPGSTLGFTRHAIQCEQVADSYLAHKIFGPATTQQPATEPDRIVYYSYVQNLIHRTGSKLLSFSWKNKLTGMIVPTGPDHEDNPFFTVPIDYGLIGSTSLSTGGSTTTVQSHAWRTIPSGCETSGVLITNSGQLQQHLKVTSVGQRTVVYQDTVTALANVTVTKELGVPFGIENDSISGGTRVVRHSGGEVTFNWQSPQPTVVFPGKWVNVDGRLGIVTALGSSIAYTQATGYSSGIAVYRDVLYGSYSTTSRSFSAGDQIARRIVIAYTEVTPEETAALAQSVRIEKTANGEVVRFALPEGGEGEVLVDPSIPTVTPDTASVAVGGTQQFSFSSNAVPITWQVIDESVPGVGTIDSNGLFTATAVGTCRIRATDAQGYSDESSTVTVVAGPTLSPSGNVRVLRWGTVAFSFSPAVGAVTWQVINESGPAGTIGTINSNGLFTGIGVGTCKVRATDGAGNTAVSGLITVASPGQFSYAPDANTVALYHLDEAAGVSWADSSGNGLTATSTATSPAHVTGVFGNAAGEFRWTDTSTTWIQTASSSKFQTPEMTVECWVYFPAGVDILAATAPGTVSAPIIRGILSQRLGGNSWSLCAGPYSFTNGVPNGVPGGVSFVYWGSPANTFCYSTSRVFYNEIWYHVAATYRALNTTPVTYEVKIYVTPFGTTTPNLVAQVVTANKMSFGATPGIYIGCEGANTSRKFCGYIDEVRISNKVRTPEELAWTLGGIAAPSMTIGQAKSQVADGEYVSLTGIVSAAFSDCLYLEAADRSAGIRLDTSQPLGLSIGDVGTVAGKLATTNGERCLLPIHAEQAGLPAVLTPIGISNRSAGGAWFGLQPGATGSVGLNTFGQLVRVWGKWTSSSSDSRGQYFTIDDGSSIGIRVYYNGSIDPTNRSIAVTGILVPVNDAPSHTACGILPTAEIQLTD